MKIYENLYNKIRKKAKNGLFSVNMGDIRLFGLLFSV